MLDYKNYRDFNCVNGIIIEGLTKIPDTIDLIIGIPRSGLIVSTLIAEYTRKPSTDLFSYLSGVNNYKLNGGSLAPASDVNSANHILLVDDAMGVGITMEKAKNMILQKNPNVKVTTCVEFVEPFSANKVDIYFEILRDQFLPWSVLKRGISDACCDIDGVLTEEVPSSEDDDGCKYIEFLKNQRPKFRPDRKINTLVTGRLEKYRGVTEDWLRRHGVQYGRLIMLNLPNKLEKSKQDTARFKGEVFKNSGLPLFIESDIREANVIKSMNPGKSVYCMGLADYVY